MVGCPYPTNRLGRIGFTHYQNFCCCRFFDTTGVSPLPNFCCCRYTIVAKGRFTAGFNPSQISAVADYPFRIGVVGDRFLPLSTSAVADLRLLRQSTGFTPYQISAFADNTKLGKKGSTPVKFLLLQIPLSGRLGFDPCKFLLSQMTVRAITRSIGFSTCQISAVADCSLYCSGFNPC